MRGRKPIYSQDERLAMAERLSSGESPTAIGKAMSRDGKAIPRTSVLQSAKSARLPAELREQVLIHLKAKNAQKLLKLWSCGVDKVLRRIDQLAPKADEKGIHLMGQTLAAIKAVLPSGGSSVQGKMTRVTDETRMIFERTVGVQRVSVTASEAEAPKDLGGSNPDDPAAPAEGQDDGAAAPTEAA